MTYQTTKEIKSLAGGGFALGARQSVTPDAFPPELWARLLADGSVIELSVTAVPEPMPDELVTEIYTVDYSSLTLKQLKDEADRRGVSYPKNVRKAGLIARLTND